MNADTLLERLRGESPDGPVSRLADIAADELLATPLGQLIDPTATAEAFAALAQEHVENPAAHAEVERRIEAMLAELESKGGTLRDLMPAELRGALAEIADQPFAPDRRLIVDWLDREPVRHLLRKLMQEALVAFGRRLSSPVAESRITRGLGDLGRIARDAAIGRAGTFGALATDLVGAVSSEVEKQLERRAAEFAESAIAGLLHRIADLLANPDLADEQADLRQALLEGFFELSATALAAEGRRADPAALGAIVRKWLGQWLERDGAEEELAEAIIQFLGEDAEKPAADVLADLGLADAARDVVADFLEARLRPFIGGETFAKWLQDVMR